MVERVFNQSAIIKLFFYFVQGIIMTEFHNVTVVKQANVYFDGKVISRTVKFDDGSIKTLGFMQIGEYTFNTASAELMEILSGELDVLLPNSNEWQRIIGGQAFNVPAQASFTMKVNQPTDYICSFLK